MRSFDEMATLGSPPTSPTPNRRPRRWARKCERYCCQTVTYFPLVFVYGLTSWAVWVEASLGFTHDRRGWSGPGTSVLGILLYLLLNSSYTTAVFTDPGSTLVSPQTGYSHLPTHESGAYSSLTVKSTGEMRFCKKCQARKPDRAHHCSTCRRCVLKMDHHCPWLATCVGLRNYKMFMLFLIYTSLFCWICFLVSGTTVYAEIVQDLQFEETYMPVHSVLLSVLSGIVGLVLTGFTAWHIWLCCKGRTTIESLEKTRYLSPLKRQMQQQLHERHYIDGQPTLGEQLREIHANALPGVTRPEEGEERGSPAQASLRRNWSDAERQREHDRYRDYQDERDSDKLPNAFDLGWKRNVQHVFGENKWLWPFPIANSTGDGWLWETNSNWMRAREQLAREREATNRIQKERERAAGWNLGMTSPNVLVFPQHDTGAASSMGLDARLLGVPPDATPMRDLPPRNGESRVLPGESDDYDTSSDEDVESMRLRKQPGEPGMRDWNDIPADLLHATQKGASRSKPSSGRPQGPGGREEWSRWDPE